MNDHEQPASTAFHELPVSETVITIEVGVAECINYAALQNSVAFLQSIEVTNASTDGNASSSISRCGTVC